MRTSLNIAFLVFPLISNNALKLDDDCQQECRILTRESTANERLCVFDPSRCNSSISYQRLAGHSGVRSEVGGQLAYIFYDPSHLTISSTVDGWLATHGDVLEIRASL